MPRLSDDLGVDDPKKLHENIQTARSVLIMIREDLHKLKAKYKPGDLLDDLEDFESYYNSMAIIFNEIVQALRKNDAFALEHKPNELMMKHFILTKKVIALESGKPADKQNKELLDHFNMRQTDRPTTRKTLDSWVKGRVVDIANPDQSIEDLIKALECYIQIRSSEKKRWLSGFNKQDKLEGAAAMIDFLKGNQTSLTTKQLEAITSDDLGKIIAKFQCVVPDVDFNEKTQRWDLEAKVHAPHPHAGAAAAMSLEPDREAPSPTRRSSS